MGLLSLKFHLDHFYILSYSQVMRKALLLLLLLTASGCATLKTQPSLDIGFSSDGKALASDTKLTTNSFFVNRHLRNKFSTKETKNELTLSKVEQKGPTKGFQCFEPYLLILSLGLIPTVCSTNYVVNTTWTGESGTSSSKMTEFTEKRVVGWASLFLSMSKDWKLTIYKGVEPVIFNEINKEAEPYR